MKPSLLARLAIFGAICSVMLFAGVALADEAPPLVNPNPAGLVGWCTVGYAVIGMVVSVLRPDNTSLPFTVPTAMRVYFATGGGIALACLLAIVNGTPWMQAIGAAAASAFAAFATHGARTLPGATEREAVTQKSGRPPPMP